ncbi:MAG: hypothetical protein AB9872_05870 [Solidesulfovibrio sp.]
MRLSRRQANGKWLTSRQNDASTRAPSVREILAKSESYLTEKGVDAPRLSAQLLLAEALGLDRLGLGSGYGSAACARRTGCVSVACRPARPGRAGGLHPGRAGVLRA